MADAHGEQKLLMEAQKQAEKRAAGATKTDKQDVKGKVVEFLWWMKKQGFSEHTITSRSQILSRLIKLGANLLSPDSVSEVIAKQERWSAGRKANVIHAYALFCKWLGLKWEVPRITVPRKLPYIPLERELDDLIAGCSKYVALALQIAKETGARAGEIFRLKWTDVNLETKTINITPEKGSNPRSFRISDKLFKMLINTPKEGERIFSRYKSVNTLRRTFEKQKRKIAYKLGNPRLLQINFIVIRHWFATMTYYKHRDFLEVVEMLGHKNPKNTLIYTHLVKSLRNDNEEFVSRVARTVEEARELIEAGFEYVCDMDGVKIFRKRKW